MNALHYELVWTRNDFDLLSSEYFAGVSRLEKVFAG